MRTAKSTRESEETALKAHQLKSNPIQREVSSVAQFARFEASSEQTRSCVSGSLVGHIQPCLTGVAHVEWTETVRQSAALHRMTCTGEWMAVAAGREQLVDDTAGEAVYRSDKQLIGTIIRPNLCLASILP